MASAFSVNLDTSAFEKAIQGFADDAAENVRPAAQAGAQIFYDEVLDRVPVGLKGHWFHGKSFAKTGQKYYFDAGSLKAAIYQVYSKDQSAEGKRATYQIAWNHKKAPYGFMVEVGTSRAPAQSFLRKSYEARQKDISDAMRDTFVDRMKAKGVAT